MLLPFSFFELPTVQSDKLNRSGCTMKRRERLKHDHPVESMVIIHDGVCGSPESYACTESRDLARILMRIPERFGLLDVCECGCPVWAAIVRRERVPELLQSVEDELDDRYAVEEAETDIEWHEETVDHLANVSASSN